MPVDAPLFPVNLVVRGRRCLVVGGGRVAARKAAALIEAGADVYVVAPRIEAEMAALSIRSEARPYESRDLAGAWLVITATDDAAVNAQVAADASEAGIWVNSADDPANCTFTLPAVARRGPILATFSTGGHSPALASWLRAQFEAELGPDYDTLLQVLAEARAEIQAAGRPTEGLDWQKALDSGMLEAIRAGNVQLARERLQACL